MFKPSEQQQAVLEWVNNGFGHGIIEAVAGSGKTSLLLELIRQQIARGKRVAYLVYNTKNSDEAKSKMGFVPGAFINTCHGFGKQAWCKINPAVKIDAYGKSKIIKDLLAKEFIGQISEDTFFQVFPLVMQLLSFAKDKAFGIAYPATDKQTWLDVIDHYGLEGSFTDSKGELPHNWNEIVCFACKMAYRALQHSVKLSATIIDFGDMIYMPLVSNARLYTYDLVLIDEAQDTNPARRELAKRMLKPGAGRLIAVGDPFQAIYGFTGADNDSLDQIRKEFNAETFPLSVSFRCSKAAIKIAKQWVSHIEASPGNVEGSYSTMPLSQLQSSDDLNKDDAILCRNTAPLVDLAYSLLKRGIPCHVEGKSIGEGLIKLIEKWKKVKTVGTFLTKLESYRIIQVEKLISTGKEMAADSLNDRVETLNVLAGQLPEDESIEVLKSKISVLFVDSTGEKHETLTLSTIHKSKGREFNRVFWLGRNAYQPSNFARQQWQLDQENNLCYVAATRAKIDLIEVIVPPKKR